ncbi:MAG: ABC transporter permease [Acidobacteria bacterium]|nr:MAG: ABC transporter permease [Acidobacteriota bacterium]
MRFVFAALLAAHGIAHLVGFVASWRLADLPDLPYKTTILGGRVDVEDGGIRIIGLFWFAAAAAFCLAAFAVAAQWPSALRLTGLVIAGSTLLCIVGWPDARIGLWLNLALAVLVVVAIRMQWAI